MKVRAWAVVFTYALTSGIAASAAADDGVQKAVDRGVAFLQNHPGANGTWSFAQRGHRVGVSSLVGLALLECNVPAADQVIRAAAQAVRQEVRDINDTYDISLAVMFLDRLGVADDNELIENCCLRLVAGQSGGGGWGYSCPKVSGDAERRLRTLLEKQPAGKRNNSTSAQQKQQPPTVADLANNQQGFRGRGGDDNSNTQFANLALWIARRHQLKADAALAAVEARYLRSQHNDGGWGYIPTGGPGRVGGFLGSTASMTCAGLLGLAVGYGVSTESVLRTDANRGAAATQRERIARDPNRERAIQRGLSFIGRVIETALNGASNDEDADRRMPEPRRGLGEQRARGVRGRGGLGRGWTLVHNGLGSEYYFLWSLERVAMVYGLDTVGNKDWFALGSKYILEAQEDDGAWRGNCGEIVDTCFALFFLRRANLAGDLTVTLRGRVRDTDVAILKAKPSDKQAIEKKEDSVTPMKEQKAAPVEPRAGNNTKPPPRRTGNENSQTEVTKSKPLEPATPAENHEQAVGRLRDQLVNAPLAEQAAILERLRDEKGTVHTDALAAAIPRLRDAAKLTARDALAQRLARMTPATLREKIGDQNPEVRRAAALACAMKDDKTYVPDLIGLLEDAELRVARAAHAALKALAHEDFGPANGASQEERKRAISSWRRWWEKNKPNR
jgi:hypothetical protein